MRVTNYPLQTEFDRLTSKVQRSITPFIKDIEWRNGRFSFFAPNPHSGDVV